MYMTRKTISTTSPCSINLTIDFNTHYVTLYEGNNRIQTCTVSSTARKSFQANTGVEILYLCTLSILVTSFDVISYAFVQICVYGKHIGILTLSKCELDRRGISHE